jgi:hypothetical protein
MTWRLFGVWRAATATSQLLAFPLCVSTAPDASIIMVAQVLSSFEALLSGYVVVSVLWCHVFD